MKKENSKKGKFNLEKFEVAKLKNLKVVFGGDTTRNGTGNDTFTNTSKDCPNSGRLCKDITG